MSNKDPEAVAAEDTMLTQVWHCIRNLFRSNGYNLPEITSRDMAEVRDIIRAAYADQEAEQTAELERLRINANRWEFICERMGMTDSYVAGVDETMAAEAAKPESEGSDD